MKLSDPFGRLARRQQADYETMRDRMIKSGINTTGAAREIITQSKQRSQKFLAIAIVVLLLLTLLMPKMMPLTGSLAVFLIIFIVNSNRAGQRYVERYIEEELKQKK